MGTEVIEPSSADWSVPKVLMVDDEQLLLNVYKRVLEFECDLYIASSGIEALETIKQSGPFSVIISDYRMPCMDGHELITEIRKTDQKVSCALLTGNQMDDQINDKFQDKVFRILNKPCKTTDILEAVQMGHQAYLDSLKFEHEADTSIAAI